MSDFDRNYSAVRGFGADRAAAIDQGLRAHMIRVYNYMAAGVALTGVLSYVVAQYLVNDPALFRTIYASPAALIVFLLPIGIATTRIVNFINDELWGKVCDPDQPWCIKFPAVDGYRHPSQIYEAILDILAVPLLLWLVRRRPADGVVAWTWFTLYGITRSLAELWRQADFTAFGLTGGQLYALPMIIVGVIGVVYCARRPGPRTDARPPSPAHAARR